MIVVGSCRKIDRVYPKFKRWRIIQFFCIEAQNCMVNQLEFLWILIIKSQNTCLVRQI